MRARAVFAQNAHAKLPVQTAYKLFNFLKTTDKDEAFYNEKRRDIIDRYAQRDDKGEVVLDGASVVLLPESTAECKQEMQDLDNTNIEMPAQFSIQELGGLSLSMADILAIEELLIEEESMDGC